MDGALNDTRFILVRAECPYVQFAVACVINAKKGFVVGGINVRERDWSQVSDGKVERMPRARLLFGYVLCDVLCVESIHPLSGVPCPPFYRSRGSRDYRWEKEKKIRGREGPSKVSGLPFPSSLPC